MNENRRYYSLRVVLSLLVVAVAVANGYARFTHEDLPFGLHQTGLHHLVIEAVQGVPLPAGLEDSDRIALPAQNLAARIALVRSLNRDGLPAHQRYSFVVERAGRTVAVPVQTRSTFANWEEQLTFYLAFIFYTILMIIALLTLWLGRERVAWSICLWVICFAVGTELEFAPTTGLTGAALLCASLPFYLLGRICFYVMAENLVRNSLAPRLRRWMRIGFAVVLVLGFALELSQKLLSLFVGRFAFNEISILWSLAYAVPPLLLLIAYGRVEVENRLRVRWVIWSALVFLIGVFVSNTPAVWGGRSKVVVMAAYILGLLGMLYAVLRHRVVDISFLVNRTLVYSATLGLVVIIFSLLETVLERSAIGHNASLVLALGVPLILGLLLEPLRKRIDQLSEWLFFHRKFAAQEALRRFARDCAYIEDPDHLLDETEREFIRHTQARAIAIYERDENGYRRVRQRGAIGFPEQAGLDDRAFVAARGGRQITDLADIESALGSDGYVFPMMVHGVVVGVLVCANRPGERYASDELELLAHVTHEVAASLVALLARENSDLVKALARGELPPEAARQQARALAKGWTSA